MHLGATSSSSSAGSAAEECFPIVCRPRWLARWPSLLRLPIKLILQAFSLLWMMFVAMPTPEAILLQVGCA